MASRIAHPPPDLEEKLATQDGEILHIEAFSPRPEHAATKRPIAVFVHGFSSYASPFRHVAEAFRSAGFPFVAFDCRGHGRSTGQRGYVERFSKYADDLAAVVAWSRALLGAEREIVLIGHSQGGAVILDYLLSNRPPVIGAVVAAPLLEIAVAVPVYKRIGDLLFGRLFPRVPLGNELDPAEVSRNTSLHELFGRDPLIHHVATPRWFHEVNAMGPRLIAAAGGLAVPVLMLTPTEDRVVTVRAQEAFAAAAPAEKFRLKSYPGLFHDIFLEPERDDVIADVLNWALALGKHE